MGNGASKRRSGQTKSNSSSRTSTLQSKKRARHADSHSLSSGVDSRRSSISFNPDPRLRGNEVKRNGHVTPPTTNPPADNVTHGSFSDINQGKPVVTVNGKPVREAEEIPGLEPQSELNQQIPSGRSSKANSVETTPVHTPDLSDRQTHPDSGARYNGSGALPKSQSNQDVGLFSRVVRNKKATIQQLWEATKDDSKKKLSQLCDVTILPTGHIAVSRSETGKAGLLLYDMEDGGRCRVLGEDLLLAPRGVCSGANTIAVTDWRDKTVQFMDMNGGFIGSWKTNKFQHPGGLSMTREGRYVVADISRKQAAIGLYSPYGKLFRRFGTDSFDWPWYVTVDRRNRILVSERKNGIINVFDDDCRFLFKFGGRDMTGGSSRSAKSEETFNCPGGIAVDVQNNILVSDTDNYRLAMFSPDGLFIKNLVTTTFSRPISVAYDDGLVAMVTDSDLRFYKTYAEKTSF